MPCLPTIHHPVLHTLPIRMSITPLPYSLRDNNPNMIMHMYLNPWGAREESQDHALADFEPYPGHAIEGQAFGGVP